MPEQTENEFEFQGKRYRAETTVLGTEVGLCEGCAFDNRDDCDALPHDCCANGRSDDRYVIFVEVAE